MTELTTGFESLPPEYKDVICLAQDRNKIQVTPLQLLVGGWSGAVVYLVSVSSEASNHIEHCILKLDRRGKSTRSDEVTRHNRVINKSTPAFGRDHVAELVFDRIEHEGTIAIFYRIAGQSLLKYRPLTHYERPSQLRAIFARTNQVLLNKWNVDLEFQQAVHPQKVLETWLGFRLDAGGNIERLLQERYRISPEVGGFLINGRVFPNPLFYARKAEPWGNIRPIDIARGFIHGDLNANNILVRFSEDNEELEGYYLIDFALFKEQMPLFYDQRYLEMSYLMHAMSQVLFAKYVHFLTLMAVADIPDPHKMPVETSGVSGVIASARHAFATWVQNHYPSLHDDLWGQYWLAGVAAGLGYCHKPGLPSEHRLAGLIYAAANLKRFGALFPLTTPVEVTQLYDENKSSDAPQSRSITRPSLDILNNLPTQPTAFIGRAQEITNIRNMLLREDIQLLTLTGPGGTGKTRLSLEVARGLLERFKDGVCFVSLADITDPGQVISRIAKQLGVWEGGSQPLFQSLKDYLQDKNTLLLLDNFEHLLPAAPMVAELLAYAPSLKVAVTSRIRLNLRGEQELAVLPLDVPDSMELPPLERLSGNESVQLFVTRARAAQPSFTLTADNALAVAQICQRLDGLPLAIELAAARIKSLPPQAMLARLSDRLKLLTGGAQDLPSRQRTLRSTLDWSYGLLHPQEKALYARLAVFVGGFTLESAEAVCNSENDQDILEGITSLVNSSLLKQEGGNSSEPRFRMLETIREYALERLVENGELATLQQSHALYFANIIINEAGYALFSARATYWLNWLESEHDNILEALRWTQTAPEGLELGPPLVTFLNWFWYRRGFLHEGRMWTERVLASSANIQPKARGPMVLQMVSLLAMWQGDLNIAIAKARESLALWQKIEDEQNLAWATLGTGIVLVNMGKDREAHALLKEAQILFGEIELPYMQAVALVHLGNVALGLGKPEEANQWHHQAYPIFREIGEEWGLSFVLNNLGEVARVQGDYEQAGKYYEESEALLRATGAKGDQARLVHTLGYIALYRRNFKQAEAQFRESLTMFRKLGNKRGIAECIAGLAGLRARQEKPYVAAQMLGAAEALLGVSGAAWWPADRVEVETTQSLLEAALSGEELETARKKGQGMTLEQAIAFVSND